jgi:predicted AAA+ superfamily ATPase
MQNTLKELIAGFHENGIPKYIDREIPINLNFLKMNVALVLIGPRKAGKTYVLYDIMNKILNKGHELEEFIYINFEHELLAGMKKEELQLIEKAYADIYPNKKPIFFLDEIQNIDGWQFFVRRLIEQQKKVVITGSNSNLLSSELATHLGGSYIEHEIMPLSFQEYLKFKNVEATKKKIHGSPSKMNALLKDYLLYGGFPEISKSNDDELRKKLIRSYFNTLVYRDIADRYKLKDTKTLVLMIEKIKENITNPFAYRKIELILKDMGFSMSRATLLTYEQYLNAAYFLFPVFQLRNSFVEREKERKAYFADNFYVNHLSLKPEMDKLVENAVFLQLRKLGKVNYLRNGKEIDFVLTVEKKHTPIQVSYDISKFETFQREQGGLDAGEQFLKQRGYLISMVKGKREALSLLDFLVDPEIVLQRKQK